MKSLFVLMLTGFFHTVHASSAGSDLAYTHWLLARTPHFELYSDATPVQASGALKRFEDLRAFFDRHHIIDPWPARATKSPVSVIAFSARKEYESFKIRASSDAYYVGTADRDYIALPLSESDSFRLAAHEYAHFWLHSADLKLPPWLSEGLAELFATVNITDSQCEIGGELPSRVNTLQRQPWLSAAELLASAPASTFRDTQAGVGIFYAESWAVTEMLALSPEYASQFSAFIAALNSGLDSHRALDRVYKKSAEDIVATAQKWVAQKRFIRRTLPSVSGQTIGIQIEQIPQHRVRAIIADLLFVNGELDRAEQMYKALLHESPQDAEVLASLGTVELSKADRGAAATYWHDALEQGVTDAVVCYRYALLADEMNLPSAEIQRALEQAIRNKPNFDDARYKLAFLLSNTGNYAAAVEQLQCMSKPGGARAFPYWTALSYALAEIDRREEAEIAARQAMNLATTSEQRARAAELAYIARTDLAVRFARGADGSLQLVTTRIPHATTEFNPFVEPGDQIQVAIGELREVQCGQNQITGFVVESDGRFLTLSVPDPLHILMRNGPAEFTCGSQIKKSVKVQYAAATNVSGGILRGMEFQ